MAFRYFAPDEHPDHSTLAEFRKRHLEALAGLFTQALQLCQKAGLVKLGHVAIDGSKLQANASKHKAMSYGRMGETEKRLKEEIDALLKRAEAEDAAEDEKYGKGRSGDELPAELARRESRLAKMRAAKAELEAEARAASRGEESGGGGQNRRAPSSKRSARARRRGAGAQVPDPETATPEAKAQRNFTDPESRIMPGGSQKGAFVQGYNAQIAVDGQRRSSWPWTSSRRPPTTINWRRCWSRWSRIWGASRRRPAPIAATGTRSRWRRSRVRESICTWPPASRSTGDEPASQDDPIRTQAAKNHLCEKRMKQKLKTRSGPGRVSHAQGHRGAGVRADQGVARVPAIFVAWLAERAASGSWSA